MFVRPSVATNFPGTNERTSDIGSWEGGEAFLNKENVTLKFTWG